MTGWTGRTATEIAAAVGVGQVAPREVVAEHLALIERLDPHVGAFRKVLAERALHDADALAGRADLAALPLAGVPVAIKDNLPVEGEATRHGSAATPDTPATADHETVRRLRAAGAPGAAGRLPLSVQLVAPPGGELRLLALAAELERRRPWPRTAPEAG